MRRILVAGVAAVMLAVCWSPPAAAIRSWEQFF